MINDNFDVIKKPVTPWGENIKNGLEQQSLKEKSSPLE